MNIEVEYMILFPKLEKFAHRYLFSTSSINTMNIIGIYCLKGIFTKNIVIGEMKEAFVWFSRNCTVFQYAAYLMRYVYPRVAQHSEQQRVGKGTSGAFVSRWAPIWILKYTKSSHFS